MILNFRYFPLALGCVLFVIGLVGLLVQIYHPNTYTPYWKDILLMVPGFLGSVNVILRAVEYNSAQKEKIGEEI